MDITVGDIVYFTKYSPDEIEVWTLGNKKTYLVVKHHAILAVEK
jgi:co-chaperonin GroES (HSP10)